MAAVLDRAFLRASGPDAVAYLQSMVTNDVEAVEPGGGTYALLLTPKARVISDLEVFRVGGDLVLACPPEVVDDVVGTLVRARFRKKVAFDPVEYALVWGDAEDALAELQTEAGLETRAISFTKGCYPGQEPVARLHYRGHANRGVRGVRFDGALVEPGAEVSVDGAAVGRITSV